MIYFPHYYHYYGKGPVDVPVWAICILSGTLIIGAGALTGAIIYSNNRTEESMEELNTKIERDLDVDSFSTQTVIFDKTNENYVIRIAGSSKETSYLTADYKVSEQDFYDIKPSESDFTKIKGENFRFIDKLVDILYRSEFLGKEEADVALAKGGEVVLNLSKPYVDEETNSVSYNLTVAKLQNNDLKLGTFVVSAPLDEELETNPKAIYSLPSDKVEVEKVDVKTYKDVQQVEMHDDYTLII